MVCAEDLINSDRQGFVGKTIAYATNGSLSHYNVLDFIKQFGLKAKLASTGAAAETFKELEANHIDVGWAAPPFGLDEIEQDKFVSLRARTTSPGSGR